MSRDGLTEKNLWNGSSKNISQKAGELPKIRSPEFALERPEKEKLVEGETKDSRKKRRYQITESRSGRVSHPQGRLLFLQTRQRERKKRQIPEGKNRPGRQSRRRKKKGKLTGSRKRISFLRVMYEAP